MVFWLVIACMIILAFAFVLPPLIRQPRREDTTARNEVNIGIHKERLQVMQSELNRGELSQKEFDNAMYELERSLLSDISDDNKSHTNTVKAYDRSTRTAMFITIVLPIFAVGMYLILGEKDLIDTIENTSQSQSQNQGEQHSVSEMVDRLSLRLQEQPGKSEDWLMLARSNIFLERFDDAVNAYRKAHELIGDEPQFLSDFAEALILANNGHTEESINLIKLALQNNPDTPKALWIAGNYARQMGDTEQALKYFERLLTLLPPGSNEAKTLQNGIAQIKQNSDPYLADSTVESSDSSEITRTESASATASIDVLVSLDPALLEKISPDDTVFIFARATQGPRMPLAIVRKQAHELPVKVTLDDSTAMSPATKLSKFSQVIIGARISKSGEAMPHSGDMEGLSAAIKLSEIAAVKVTINKILP